MNNEARPADRLAELPEETRQFLSKLDEEDIETLDQGLRLVRATMTVGRFAKWLIVGILGLFVGMVMFVETVQRVMAWFKPPPN